MGQISMEKPELPGSVLSGNQQALRDRPSLRFRRLFEVESKADVRRATPDKRLSLKYSACFFQCTCPNMH
jgi:hypothetical protein